MSKNPVKRRRTFQHTARELNDVDYYHKLTPEEREYLRQFMYEYYQADFNFENPIHGPELVKDCRDRNNTKKRRFHSIGSNLREYYDSKAKAKSGHYNLDDYRKSCYDPFGDESDDEE